MKDDAPTIPPLEARFLEPQGFVWGTFTNARGQTLRWGCYTRPGADKTCVLEGGFIEFVEKYFETIRDLAARGFSVWSMDWLGQGGSTRSATLPTRPRARDYEADADDLAKFTREIVTPLGPKLYVGHSMGGAIGLLALARHKGLFDAAVLTAPMLGLAFGPLPMWLGKIIIGAQLALGGADRFVPGGKAWRPDAKLCPDRSHTSNDPMRCLVMQAWFIARPALRVDDVTYGWVDAALRLIATLSDPSLLKEIKTPILIASAWREKLVDPKRHRAAAALLPDCTLVDFPEAKHELFMELDAVRVPLFAAIDRFVSARLTATHAAE